MRSRKVVTTQTTHGNSFVVFNQLVNIGDDYLDCWFNQKDALRSQTVCWKVVRYDEWYLKKVCLARAIKFATF